MRNMRCIVKYAHIRSYIHIHTPMYVYIYNFFYEYESMYVIKKIQLLVRDLSSLLMVFSIYNLFKNHQGKLTWKIYQNYKNLNSWNFSRTGLKYLEITNLWLDSDDSNLIGKMAPNKFCTYFGIEDYPTYVCREISSSSVLINVLVCIFHK